MSDYARSDARPSNKFFMLRPSCCRQLGLEEYLEITLSFAFFFLKNQMFMTVQYSYVFFKICLVRFIKFFTMKCALVSSKTAARGEITFEMQGCSMRNKCRGCSGFVPWNYSIFYCLIRCTKSSVQAVMRRLHIIICYHTHIQIYITLLRPVTLIRLDAPCQLQSSRRFLD